MSSDLPSFGTRAHSKVQCGITRSAPGMCSITVPAMEEINAAACESPRDGTISLPFIGRVQAVGLTEAELADQLRPRLKDYLRNPRVSIFVKEYNSRQVAVLGAVVRPGLYNLTSGSENIRHMISRAGRILPDAEPRIQLIPTEPLKGMSATYNSSGDDRCCYGS